ncbi:disease resistance protein RPM1-like [Punica granatum]|nr:disease resistance protein RPM1-like [Punica granatum]
MDRELILVVKMGGLGKTTLANQAFDDPAVKKHFAVRVWVTLSPSFQDRRAPQGHLQQVASQTRKSTPRRAADTSNCDWPKMMIKSVLLNKRYLIFLDDIWHKRKWDAIKYAFPNDKHGSRLMLTMRNNDVASASCANFGWKVYELMPLPEEESWKLFYRKTFEANSCPPNLEVISKFILRKCEGLPLPIVAIGGVLASKDIRRVDEWDLVRRTLRVEIDSNDRLRKINKVLSLSFDDLPYYLKSCFLHLSVYLEGHVIKCMSLIRLRVAEGFVQEKRRQDLGRSCR